jgi:hypothetical protein
VASLALIIHHWLSEHSRTRAAALLLGGFSFVYALRAVWGHGGGWLVWLCDAGFLAGFWISHAMYLMRRR